MTKRPLRGLCVLAAVIAAAVCSYSSVVSFAVQSSPLESNGVHLRLRSGAAVDAVLASPKPSSSGIWESKPLTGGARDLGSAARLAPKDSRSREHDSVSLLLASAGIATAMAAASAAASESAEATEPAKSESEGGSMESLKVPLYIGLWYLFNIGYNIYNKKALLIYPYPWANALWQMFFGCLIFVPMWAFGIRKPPQLTFEEQKKLIPSALGHLATHVGAVVAFFAGAVSFGHIVKASEPVVSSLLNFVFMKEVLALPVYAALLPIIGGVGLASVSELSFTWLAFGAAMASNIGSAGRAVVSKKIMKDGIGKNMTSSNFYAVLTILATIMLIPISFAIEGPSAMLSGFKAAYAKGGTQFLLHMIYAGFTYYMYNEVAFLALGQLDPVSHAVCNTMKRVVIIITAVIVFRNPVTPLGVIGSCVAIAGTLLYSLAKNKFAK